MSAEKQQIKSEIQNLKGFLTKLGEDELITIFNTFLQISSLQIERQCKMISYKCYESTYQCKQKKANGYGRNEKEANINCIRNILEFLLEDPNIASLFKQAIQQISNSNETNPQNDDDINNEQIQPLKQPLNVQSIQSIQQDSIKQLQQMQQQNNQLDQQQQNNMILPNLDQQAQAQLIEELKRSKNYINHLEKKVNLVMEENKILKQLLLENKKQQQNQKQQNKNVKENQPPVLQNSQQNQIQQQNFSISQKENQSKPSSKMNTNHNSSVKMQQQQSNSQKIPFNQTQSQNFNQQSTSHLISQPYEILHRPSKPELNINLNNISVNNNLQQQQQQQLNTSINNNNNNNNSNNVQFQQFQQQQQQQIEYQEQNNTNQNFYQSQQEDFDDKKFRSQSVDITQQGNNKRIKTMQNEDCNKSVLNNNNKQNLDISCDNIKVKKTKKSVPKLNLTILPNYHGKNGGKSLNQLLQQQKFWCK